MACEMADAIESAGGDGTACEALLRDFYYPFAKIRDRKVGYAGSAIKAGVALLWFETGAVRSPLTNLTNAERKMLRELINHRK